MFQRPVRLPCTLNPRSPPRARLPLILAAGRVRTSVPRQSHAARLCCARCGYLLLLSRRAAQLIVYYKRVCAPIRPKPLLLLVTDALPSSDPSVSRRCLCQGSSYRSLLPELRLSFGRRLRVASVVGVAEMDPCCGPVEGLEQAQVLVMCAVSHCLHRSLQRSYTRIGHVSGYSAVT